MYELSVRSSETLLEICIRITILNCTHTSTSRHKLDRHKLAVHRGFQAARSSMAPNNRTQPGRLDFVKLGHPTNLLCKNQSDKEAGVHAPDYISLPGSTV